MNEIWKDVKDYIGYYKISNLGRIKRIKSFRKNGASGYFQKEKILKQTERSKNKYLCVHLSMNGKAKVLNIHRLIAEAWLPNPENKPQINHKNGIKDDNKIENLEWCTASENMQHAIKVLNFKPNTDGLKLGAPASIKKNLNISNGFNTFNTYKEIINFIKTNPKYKNTNEKNIKTHVRSCCLNNQKTAYGYTWEYNKLS